MEEDEIHQIQACKFPRVGNSRNDSNKYPNEELEDGGGELRRRGCDDNSSNLNRFNNNWQHSSRIIRVSRASGGKDRHSKVMTSKGLRDRRVRLSVTTAIQFYDLQDRLGYDQPSKAVEWLIKSASDAISELPSLNNTFPDTPKQPSDEKRASFVGTEQGFDSADAEMENGTTTENGENNYQQNNNQSQNLSLSKSACSSTSETSKGSGLSLSRSDIRVNRVKARERARERTAKEKEKENESHNNIAHHQHNVNSISQTASFTELLTGGMNNTANSPRGGGDEVNLFHKATRQQWSSAAAPMDYFSPVLLGPSSSCSSRNHHHQNSSGFSLSQIQLGHNSLPDNAMSMSSVSLSPFSTSDQLQQQYSFIPHDHHHHHHLMPAVVTSSQPTGNNNDYNLNFTISSGLAGYNRGTLQSNSPSSLLPHLQRFSSPSLDGSSTVPFFMGAAPASASAAPTMENNNNNHQHQHHHQFSSVFDGSSRLHLCYGDGCRHSDQKGKSKN